MKSLGALVASVVRIWEIQRKASGGCGRSSSTGFAQMLASRVVDVDCGMLAEDNELNTRDLCEYWQVAEADGNRNKDSRSYSLRLNGKSEAAVQALNYADSSIAYRSLCELC